MENRCVTSRSLDLSSSLESTICWSVEDDTSASTTHQVGLVLWSSRYAPLQCLDYFGWKPAVCCLATIVDLQVMVRPHLLSPSILRFFVALFSSVPIPSICLHFIWSEWKLSYLPLDIPTCDLSWTRESLPGVKVQLVETNKVAPSILIALTSSHRHNPGNLSFLRERKPLTGRIPTSLFVCLGLSFDLLYYHDNFSQSLVKELVK